MNSEYCRNYGEYVYNNRTMVLPDMQGIPGAPEPSSVSRL